MEPQKHDLTDEKVIELKTKLHTLQDELAKAREPKKGFRKLAAKDAEKIEKKIQEIAQVLAESYLERYHPLCELYGIEVRAVMRVNPYQPNVAQAVTELTAYRPQEKPQTKPWHEAMADNLHTRAKCEHVLHEEGLVCEKCGLPPDKWGLDNKGVSAEYHEEQKQRIEEEKKTYEEQQQETT